jgi:hypothetical protein
MIQRIQTIFLFLAAALCVAFLFFPTWMVMNPDTGDGGSKTIVTTPMGVLVETSAMSLDNPFTNETLSFTSNTFLLLQFLVTAITVILLLATIFLYQNRPLQIKLAYGGIFLIMVTNLMMIPIRSWVEEMGGDATVAGDMYQSIPQWGLGAPLLALLLTWFAIKRIQRDEKLVKGMDRLR